MISITGLDVFEHGGNIYKATRSGCELTNLLDFSANINPLGLSDSLRYSILTNLDNITVYPDADAHDLKEAISHAYQVEHDSITTGNGAAELLYVLCNVLRPKQVLIPAPTFSEYERAARVSGATVNYFYLSNHDGFKIDVERLTCGLKKFSVDILFIGNPNNPTGTILTNREIEVILKAAQPQNTIVVVDESFMDFLPDEQKYTCRRLLSDYDNLFILHSLTKFYAIPGLRLGFSLTNHKLTNLMHQGKDPWNVNSLAQIAGVTALADQNFRQNTREVIHMNKNSLYADVQAIPELKPFWPSVNFMLVKIIQSRMTSTQLQSLLKQQNILIRDCSNYPGLSDKYFRVAVKLPEQNQKLVSALQKTCR